MALDIIETRLYKSPPPKKKKEIPKYKVTIPFVSKAMDFINLPKLLRSHESHSNMPPVMEEKGYSYGCLQSVSAYSFTNIELQKVF